MAEELKYTSEYDGATTDDLLGYAQEAKEVGVNAYVKESKELKSNEYVRSMKEQLAAEDAETVQVYDVEGVPHKITKKELISKAGIQLPSLEEIGGFVAYDTNGQALGLMSKEQVAEVLPKVNGFTNSIGGITYKGDTDTTRITEQGVFKCTNSTSDIPDGLITGLLVAIKGFTNEAYMIYWLFDLISLKRYTRLKIDSYYSQFSEF